MGVEVLSLQKIDTLKSRSGHRRLGVNEVCHRGNTLVFLKSILVDDKRLQSGLQKDDIRAFLPRSVRNVESRAQMRAAL